MTKFVPHVYIFESPKETEIEKGISEGDALSSALKLMSIKNEYHLVMTKNDFEDNLQKILPPKIESCLGIETIAIPVLHISAHGCNSSFILTNKETINWEELRDYLCPINRKCLNFLFLCMSACNGYSAIKSSFTLSKDLPYVFTVGPTQPVKWDESLLGFLVFYYNFANIIEDKEKVISTMNNAINHDGLFRCCIAEEIQEKFVEIVKKLQRILG